MAASFFSLSLPQALLFVAVRDIDIDH